MQELGVSTNANYKITFMLDSAAMITVHTPRRGLIDVSAYFFLIFDIQPTHCHTPLNNSTIKLCWSFHARKLKNLGSIHLGIFLLKFFIFWVVYLDDTAFKSNNKLTVARRFSTNRKAFFRGWGCIYYVILFHISSLIKAKLPDNFSVKECKCPFKSALKFL